MWYTILDSIHESINQEIEKKYKAIDMKLCKLMKTQTKDPDCQGQFYSWVINKTNIEFTNDELSLLNKGLKYNLSYNKKNWIKSHSQYRNSSIIYVFLCFRQQQNIH
jgi:hypothetical protein